MSSWPKFIGGCKSRFSAIARSCFLSRERWVTKYSNLCQRYREMRSQLSGTIAQLKCRQRELEKLVAKLEQEVEGLKADQKQPEEQFALPEDPHVKGQQYGAKTIELAVNLGRKIGLRPTIAALEVVYEALGIDWGIPAYQTLRTWMQRVGIARQQTVEHRDDWIWFADLSIQVGQETFMGILGIPQAKLPPEGQAICMDDLHPLVVKPIVGGWNKQKVETMYRQTIEKFGRPVAVVTDGADELRTPIKSLSKHGKTIRMVRDVKHFLANLMKKTLSETNFHEFSKAAYGTNSKIQQTELSHLAPPMCKQKARFMNLEPLLNWASMVLWQFQHSASDGRKGISDERLKEKLGWIRGYRKQIAQWGPLQEIVSTTLTFTNLFGLSKHCSRELRRKLEPLAKSNLSRKFLDQIINFIAEQEKQLKGIDRLPCSTEILESAFGKFKQLERQHAHGGFTHILAAFPTLLKPVTVHEVNRSFERVQVKHIDTWVEANLPKTLTARVHMAYDESRNGTKPKKRATCCAAMS
jgi:hypothetical protein